MTEKCGQIQGKWDFVPVGGGARVTGDQLLLISGSNPGATSGDILNNPV